MSTIALSYIYNSQKCSEQFPVSEDVETCDLAPTAYNASMVPPPCSPAWKTACNIQLFEDQAALTPNNIAVIGRRGVLSYQMLNARANRLARYLVKIGVGPETVVGVSLERGIGYIISMLAIWKANGAYLPLDVSLPADRLHYMISDSGTSYVISTTDVAVQKSLVSLPKHHILLDDPALIMSLGYSLDTNLPNKPDRADLAYVIYTSGTSGNPKGVAITHCGIPNMALDQRQTREITHEDRVMVFSRFCFDASLRDVNGALLNGASLYIPEEEEVLPGKLIDTLRQQNITYVVLTPSVLRSCAIDPLPSLRKLGVAGEAADTDLIKRWGKGRLLINAYGPTEATVCCSKRLYVNGSIGDGDPISIGPPILNTQMCVIDPLGRVLPPGEIGEIYIKGPGVSRRGYLNLPHYTAKSFSDDIVGPGRGYRSGDLGRLLPNGEIQCLGRKDRQIKVSGQRVEIEEIEGLIRGNQFVQDTIVTLHGHTEARSLTAYIVCKAPDLSPQAKRDLSANLQNTLQRRLPPYSVPSRITYIQQWPRNAANKVDVNALPDQTTILNEEPIEDATAQLTTVEIQVARILCEALDLPSDLQMKASTTYAQLGGTSLQAQIVLLRLNKEFGSNVHIGTFYSQRQTVASLAILVSHRSHQDAGAFHRRLINEARLPYDLSPQHLPFRPRTHHGTPHVLLTGATGYLGAHLLAELLSGESPKITCIVRQSHTVTNNHCRVERALRSWRLWRPAYRGRIEVISGDLSKPFMGLPFDAYANLATSVDIVWHCAAAVNFVQPYSYLKEANVTGTIEVMRFASTLQRKRLCYFSTLAVFFGANDIEAGQEISCEAWSEKIPTGYAQSKWVAEQMVLEYQRRGGDVVVLRPGRLLGSIQSGFCPTDDMTVRLITSFIETRIAPDIDWRIDFTPVNVCAKSALTIASKVENGIFHIVNPQSIELREIINHMNEIGFCIQKIPFQDWKRYVPHSAPLKPLMSLFRAEVDSHGSSAFDLLLGNKCFRWSAFSTDCTAAILRDTSVWQFPEYKELLGRYIAETILWRKPLQMLKSRISE